LSVVVLVIEMLRANVLPVVPLVLLAAGPFGLLAATASFMAGVYDPSALVAYPMLLTVVGHVWLGWYLWREPAVDAAHRHGPFATA
jgi:hypothetical protein